MSHPVGVPQAGSAGRVDISSGFQRHPVVTVDISSHPAVLFRLSGDWEEPVDELTELGRRLAGLIHSYNIMLDAELGIAQGQRIRDLSRIHWVTDLCLRELAVLHQDLPIGQSLEERTA
jgi:hypothetical protein